MKVGVQISLLVLLSVLGFQASATHIRAGEITATRVANRLLSYTFKLTVYTDTRSQADNPVATMFFGELGTTGEVISQTANRSRKALIQDKNTYINEYLFTHTFQGPGSYTVYYYEANRNDNVLNMSNSSSNSFYVETMLVIDPFLGPNNTPTLNMAPLDEGVLNFDFVHNPAAFDQDGDSLSYEIVPSRQFVIGQGAISVTNYIDPAVKAGGLNRDSSDPASLTIDPIDGTMTWNVPRNLVGEYNTAIRVSEWRLDTISAERIRIGYVIRDMQILIQDSRNRPPVIETIEDTCVQAGATLRFRVKATDPDSLDLISLIMREGVEGVPSGNQPLFSTIPQQPSPAFGELFWRTSCDLVREQPYNVVFRAEDIPKNPPPLVGIKSTLIKVIGPKPLGLVVGSTKTGMSLKWSNYRQTVCPNADKIEIYRRIDTTEYQRDSCEMGMPGSLGFSLVKTLNADETEWFDSLGTETGLSRGPVFYYRLVATFPFPGLGKSRISDQDSATLPLTVPIISQVSVTKTSLSQGEIQLRWISPKELNPIDFPGPYGYRVMRGVGANARSFTQIYTTNDLNDTSFVDKNLNTLGNAYTYRVVFLFNLNSAKPQADSGATASSVRLSTGGAVKAVQLSWQSRHPWSNGNRRHDVFRFYREPENGFREIDTLIARSNNVSYLDDGSHESKPLVMGVRYKYYVKTRGYFSNPKIKHIAIENLSQEAEGAPLDTIAPCPPNGDPRIESPPCGNCEAYQGIEPVNEISFTQAISECDSDVIAYRLYYSRFERDTMQMVQRLEFNGEPLTFRHSDNGSLAGCYYLVAEDASGNLSVPSNRICKDNCVFFGMPNIITPNGDGYNETLQPTCYVPGFIEKLDIKVYNRYGIQVYSSQDSKDRLWSGQLLQTDTKLPEGVYFYTAEVKFKRLMPDVKTELYKGWVEIIR